MAAEGFDEVYQLKVTLKGTHPFVWRRIHVPANYTFWDLHVAIQDAMGWRDCHRHVFRFNDPEEDADELIGIPDEQDSEDGSGYLPGREIPIDEYFVSRGDSAIYEYDLGEAWEHELVLEKVVPREPEVSYPRCLAGGRACPPEDCGGLPGYETLLAILADPGHEEHEQMREWVGGSYDPASFDPAAVRFEDPEERWKVAHGRG